MRSVPGHGFSGALRLEEVTDESSVFYPALLRSQGKETGEFCLERGKIVPSLLSGQKRTGPSSMVTMAVER